LFLKSTKRTEGKERRKIEPQAMEQKQTYLTLQILTLAVITTTG